MRPAYWVPPVAWMGVIVWLSSDSGSAQHTGSLLLPLFQWVWPAATSLQLDALHGIVRKLAHVTEYGVLTALWYRAFVSGRDWASRPAAWGTLGISVGWALLDELHQEWVASRTSSLLDVSIDTAGAVLVLASLRAGWRRAVEQVTSLLLWVAALGGTTLLVVNTLAGVPSGWLWLAAPTAALALAARRYWRGPSTP